MAVKKIILDIRAQLDKAIGQMKKLGTTSKTTENKIKGVKKSVVDLEGLMKKAGATFAAFFAVSKITQWGKAIGDVIADFQDAMSGLSAITGAVGKDLDFMRNKAIELSVQLKKTAKEVVMAFQLVGSAKPELLKSGAALAEVTKQAIILAQAARIDVPEAAKVLTGALNVWQKGAKDAAKYTDILANSQKKGNTVIGDLGESLVNAGAVAAAMGFSFEGTNAILQAFGAGNIKGARAGTAFEIVMRKLGASAEKDFNPRFTKMGDILENLKRRGYDDLTKATSLVQEEAAKYLLTLIAQREVVQELTGNLGGMGAALEQAKVNTENIRGAQDELTASWQAMILTMESGEGVFVKLWELSLKNISRMLNEFKVNAGMSFGDWWKLIWNTREELQELEEDLKDINSVVEEKVIVTLTTLSAELDGLKKDFVLIDTSDKEALKTTAALILAKQAQIKVIQELIKVQKGETYKPPAEAKEEEVGMEPWMLFGDIESIESRLEKAFEEIGEKKMTFDEKMAEDSAKMEQERVDSAKATALAIIGIEQVKDEAILTLTADLFGSVSQILGESTMIGKLAAIAEATIDTYAAAVKAFKWGIETGGLPLGYIAAASAIAFGLAQVSRITGIETPSFDEGGFTGRAKHEWVDRKGQRIAGVVHEDEFVFDKDKTKKLRPFFEDIHNDRIDIDGLSRLTQGYMVQNMINANFNQDTLEQITERIYKKISEKEMVSSEMSYNGGIMKKRGSVTTILK